MKTKLVFAGPLLLALLACGSSKIQNSRSYMGSERLPRPGVVLVYDFAFDPGDVAADQSGVGGGAGSEQQRRQLGERVVDSLAAKLVSKLQEEGIQAERASASTTVPLHAAMIEGRLDRIDEGDAVVRTTIGFGQGAARMVVHAEGFQQTASGRRKLGEGDLATSSGKKPGIVVPGAAAGATGQVAGLAVGGALAAKGEIGGAIQGEVDRAAGTIAEQVAARFREQGWL